MAGLTVPVFCLGAGLWPVAADGALALAFDTSVAFLPAVSAASGYRLGRLRRQIAETREKHLLLQAELNGDAFTDALTGLPNRAALERSIDIILQGDPAVGKGHGIILLDLDRFHFVNETMGRDAGDQILLILSQRLRHALGAHASLYRPGGDEFVVIVPGTPSRGKLEDVARLLGGVLREPFELSGGQFWTGGSIGVTFLQPADRSLDDILARAELALDRSKEMMGNSVAFHEPHLASPENRRQVTTRDVARGIAAGEFFLEYQPIIGIKSRSIRCMEALVRWRHPERGVVLPEAFIAAAEHSGAIQPLGRWVLATACREAMGWPSCVGVSVNVSKEQIRDPDFVMLVTNCLAETGLAAERLTIEVTEAVFSLEPHRVTAVFQALRRLGVRLALDDFGVGFTAVSNLGAFPLDQLKIDRSFTDAMLRSQRDGELIDLILKAGAAFAVSTIIEGVETEGQMELVRAMGVGEAQGFLISPPVPAGDVGALILAFEAGASRVSAA
ncbi:putative bifunctional diguanylate cyclase/phosphodiesterase [Rhizobium sp. SG2393]|uniref:putative bifunctional diguanylate cyclase/phosphodiesterase n=1 Tax=Rhizobium sp. SG2393 TaxID=3276279 RepID=UPI00366D9404